VLTLEWERGTVLIKGGKVDLPYVKFDERSGAFRTLAINYGKLVRYLELMGVKYVDNVMDKEQCIVKVKREVRLRSYQKTALDKWLARRAGIIVMPTGMGKTHVGIAAIAALRVKTLVIVPTIELIDQWVNALGYYLDARIGKYYGGEKIEGCITVTTYDSAYISIERLGNKYPLLIFDEAHHLPSEGYRQIAELSPAMYRLGLTATPERSDGLHQDLSSLVGPIVYRVSVEEARGLYIADFETNLIRVNLSDAELRRYKELMSKYREFIKRSGISFRRPSDFKALVKMSGRSKAAREALRAWREARRLAMTAPSKLDAVEEILRRHPNDRAIIFTELSDLSHEVSKRFLLPEVTYETPREEREAVMSMFRRGDVKAIVTGKVLEEGVDVPDVNLVIILGGTSSERQYVQRIGRALRLKPDKAKIYEVVTSGTREASRRHAST